MYSPVMNKLRSWLGNSTLTTELAYVHCIRTVRFLNHRWVLPVLHYPRHMLIYPYPLILVIYMVILHAFIIKKYPNLFSNYYPKYISWVIYPFILNFGWFIYEATFPEHYPVIGYDISMFSYFGIVFLIEIQWFPKGIKIKLSQ